MRNKIQSCILQFNFMQHAKNYLPDATARDALLRGVTKAGARFGTDLRDHPPRKAAAAHFLGTESR
jgi:hypothetical protein